MSEPHSQSQDQPNYQTRNDIRDLNLLSVFYYISAGLCALLGLTGLIVLLIGLVMLIVGVSDNHARPAAVGGVLVMVMAVGMLMVIWGIAALLFKAGNNLKNQRGYNYIFIMAVLVCLKFPIGTVLGVFTIIVLNRPSVRDLFDARSHQTGSDRQLN